MAVLSIENFLFIRRYCISFIQCFSYGVPHGSNIAHMEATRPTMTPLDPNMAPDDRKRRLQRIPRPSGHYISKAMGGRKLA